MSVEKIEIATNLTWRRAPIIGWSEPIARCVHGEIHQIHYELSRNKKISAVTINHERLNFEFIFHNIKQLSLLIATIKPLRHTVDSMLHDNREYCIYIQKDRFLSLIDLLRGIFLSDYLALDMKKAFHNKMGLLPESIMKEDVTIVNPHGNLKITDKSVRGSFFASAQNVHVSNTDVKGDLVVLASNIV